MKHHVVISEEIIEKRVIPKDRTGKATQRVDGREGTSSDRGGVQAKEYYEKETKVTEKSTRRVEEEGWSLDRGRDQADEYYEKKTMVTKPIALGDLFKRRSLKPGDPESEIRRVLLYGNPGSGKTCITKVVAHKWALGKMVQVFNAVYVVPVRVLNGAEYNGQEWARLEEAISQTCFSGTQHAFGYEDLVSQVEDDLDDPSTLLMLDGLDEANDHARELVSTVWKRSCKVLLLSRPHSMRDIETRVDIQVECLGFSDEQLRDYVRSELSEDEAPRYIRSLENATALWEMAHIPVTAHILCSLSKEHGSAFKEERKRVSTFQIYSDMANYVWKRFEKKPTARNIQREELFKDLEKIAFESLREGLILVHERFVIQHATSKNAARTFKDSGFLLLVLEGQKYQFPHKTYQEYFAGRYIARILKQRGSDEKRRVLDFIHGGKYDEKNTLALAFAMHAFAKGRNKQVLEELLSIMNEQPVEVLGIRHLFTRMRVLEAVLEEIDEDNLEDILNDVQAIELAGSARQLIERTIDDVLIREIVIEKFPQLSRVLEAFPQVLNDTVDGVKNMLTRSRKLTSLEMAKITDILKLAKHSPIHSGALIQFIFELVKQPDGWCDPDECIRRLESIAKQMPQHAGEVLPMLARAYNNEVCRASMESIGRVVVAAPQHAGEVLPMLAKKCDDEKMCQAAIEAIGRVVAAAPRHAGEYLPILARGIDDQDWRVRQTAFEAIGRVVAAAHQHAGEYIPVLASGCDDKDKDVCRAAIKVIGRVLPASPQYAGQYLPTLASRCADKNWEVRRTATEAIGRVVAASPHNVSEYLPTLAQGCADEEYWEVRRTATEAIGRVVAASPEHVGEHLPTLARGIGDKDNDVCRAAMEAIDRVVAAAPQHAAEHILTVARRCNDNDKETRRTAMETIGRVIAAAAQHADEYIPVLAKGCDDKDKDVRRAAMEAFGRVVATAPRHAGEHLPTLARGCDDKDKDVCQTALQAIDHVVAAAPQHAGDELPTLERGCGNEDKDVRRAAVEAVGRVVATAPHHAGEHLPTLARGCDDKDNDVRRAAIEAIGRVVAAAPQHAGEYLPTLASGYDDDHKDVRRAAMEAIGRVVVTAPQQAGAHRMTLTKGCDDKDRDVRRAAHVAFDRVVAAAPLHAGEHLPTLGRLFDDRYWDERLTAMAAITRVVEAAPQLASEHLPTLTSGCTDKHKDVRRAAVEAVGRVIAAAPQLAGELQPMLASGCADKHKDVRRAAMEAIGRVVVAAPQQAGAHRLTLKKGCGDKDRDVRRAAVETIGRVVSAAPHHAGDLLSTLAMGCKDEDSDVRFAAKKALESIKPEELVSSAISFPSTSEGGLLFFFVQNSFTRDPFAKSIKVPFVLHATSSQVIGKWDKKAIDMFIRYLRQACDKELPRLLENINIIE